MDRLIISPTKRSVVATCAGTIIDSFGVSLINFLNIRARKENCILLYYAYAGVLRRTRSDRPDRQGRSLSAHNSDTVMTEDATCPLLGMLDMLCASWTYLSVMRNRRAAGSSNT